MEPLLTFAGFVASLPIAFGLQWLCLRGVFRCLPAANRVPMALADGNRRPAGTEPSRSTEWPGVAGVCSD
jgi:hypothetical protein